MELLTLFLVGIMLGFLLTFYSAFSWGWVLFVFYYWFLLPVFPSLPEVGYIQCVGLTFIIELFRTIKSTKVEGEKLDWYIVVLAPWLTLLSGWFIHWILQYIY